MGLTLGFRVYLPESAGVAGAVREADQAGGAGLSLRGLRRKARLLFLLSDRQKLKSESLVVVLAVTLKLLYTHLLSTRKAGRQSEVSGGWLQIPDPQEHLNLKYQSFMQIKNSVYAYLTSYVEAFMDYSPV